ncbi:MAG: NUDIX hydrolase, partial [Candidatus Omnitrophica bacterium]|nr:NUDIX hydrolase [Candidatus Omnitrophota bacterium]
RGRIIRLVQEVLEVGGRRLIRETVHHPGAVVIVPLLDRSHIVFVRQYRRAVQRELLELPAGTLEPGEAGRSCAARELQEETGWRARRLRRLGRFYTAPGFTTEQITIFLAEGLTPARAQPDPDESVRPVVLSVRAALAKIRSGAICDAKSIIGVLFAQRLI